MKLKNVKQILLLSLLMVIDLMIPVWADAGATQQLVALLRDVESYKADFRQISVDGQGNELQITSGQFAVKRPGLLYWHVKPPLEQFVVSDGNRLWLYDPDLEQVTVQAMGQHVVQTPALLLSGNVDELDDIFQIRLMPGEEDEQQFELTPKQGDSLFEQLRLTFSEGTLVQMHMADSLGQRSSLEFSNTQVNPLLEDSLFQFTPPEGVDVISQ